MGDEANSLHSKQGCAAIFCVVETLFEISKCATGEQSANLARNGGFQRFLQRGANQVGNTFRNLQRNVSHESVGDNNVHFTIVQVAAFHVAHKIQGKLLQKVKCFAGQYVSLGFFLANREQSHTRPLRAKQSTKVDLSHDCKLLEIVRLAVDVGADV